MQGGILPCLWQNTDGPAPTIQAEFRPKLIEAEFHRLLQMDGCLARPSFAENRTPWLALLSSVQPRGTHPFHALTLSYLHTRLTDATYADEVGCERSPSSYFLLYTPPGLPLLSFLAHSRNLYLLLYMLFSCMVPVRNY